MKRGLGYYVKFSIQYSLSVDICKLQSSSEYSILNFYVRNKHKVIFGDNVFI